MTPQNCPLQVFWPFRDCLLFKAPILSLPQRGLNMPTKKSIDLQAVAVQFKSPTPLRRCLTAAEAVSSVRWLKSKAGHQGRRISTNLTRSRTNKLQDVTTERGEVGRKVLFFVQLILGTRLSCHLLLKVSHYLNTHQGTCMPVPASTLGGKHSLGYFKPLLQLTGCSNFLQGREPLAQSCSGAAGIVSVLTLTISSRVGRRFGRRGNVFLARLSGPLGEPAFVFEVLNVVSTDSGGSWFSFGFWWASGVWGVFLSTACFSSAFVAILTETSKKKKKHNKTNTYLLDLACLYPHALAAC